MVFVKPLTPLILKNRETLLSGEGTHASCLLWLIVEGTTTWTRI